VALLLFLLCGFTVYGDIVREVLISHTYETKVFGKPRQEHKWNIKPVIRICADTNVSVVRVDKAIQYWEKLGYRFDGIYKSYTPMCFEPRYGEILISIPDVGFDGEHMAATRLYTSTKTKEIIKAKIFILPKNASKERVLEHEIGHALGWKHYHQRYHMMHPSWKDGGYDSEGLEKDI